MRKTQVSHIGSAAAEALNKPSNGTVTGVTSKGVFLRIDNRIMFLTDFDFRSPFNLMLNNLELLTDSLQPGDKFNVNGDGFYFPGRNLHFETANAMVWLPPGPVPQLANLSEQKERVDLLISRVQQRDPEKGFLFIALPQSDTLPEHKQSIHQAAHAMMEAFRAEDKNAFIASSKKLIGAGGGLTPSGDDFLAGFHLYHFRREQAGATRAEFLTEWWRALVDYSFEKTTTISANRLEYTARGWSEWLFLEIIDHLFNPRIEFEDGKLQTLINFGHSSGVDTLVGISFAVNSLL